jgi:FKBP-type peptidyl-prolyl cis-trans isomerase (trigger factor)
MDAVRAALVAEVEKETERATNAKIHTAITEQLADMVTVDLPESLVQDQGRQNYSVQMLELLSAGQITQDVLQVRAYTLCSSSNMEPTCYVVWRAR